MGYHVKRFTVLFFQNNGSDSIFYQYDYHGRLEIRVLQITMKRRRSKGIPTLSYVRHIMIIITAFDTTMDAFMRFLADNYSATI